MGRQPAIQTPRGVIRCAYCRTDEFGLPEGPDRLDENHVGIRFGDRSGRKGVWTILLDGEDVTSDCAEAYAGEEGWVGVYDKNGLGNRYLCPTSNREHALLIKRWGQVRVICRPAG